MAQKISPGRNNRPYHDDPNHGRPRKPNGENKSWGVPLAIAAVVLVAATIIFSAAGPDRTRTAGANNPNSQRIPLEVAQPPESAIPPSNQDAAQSTPSVSRQKSNPAGTQ